jgi:hypothetical protein
MKALKVALILAAVFSGFAASADASAHGRARVGVGFYFGGPAYWGPAYYPYPYYRPYYGYAPYYDPYYAPAADNVTYIERPRQPAAPDGAAPAASSYWYYCQDSGAYYPHVKQCASPWQTVPPRPQ